MQRGDVQVTRGDERRRSRGGLLLGLLPLALLAAALVPAPAQADPQFDAGCRVQLTAEEGASGPLAAELTWACANFNVVTIDIDSVSTTPKQFLAGPFDQEGQGV